MGYDKIPGEKKKGFFAKVGDWLSNIGGAVKNKYENWETSNELGALANLKTAITNMLMKFALAFRKALVKDSKEKGRAINKVNDELAKSPNSLMGGKPSEGLVKAVKEKEQAMDKTVNFSGKTVSKSMEEAKNKATAINKANDGFGLGQGLNSKTPIR
jgi:hypothetical protein